MMNPSMNAHPAGFVSRMIAFIIDLVILSLTGAVITSLAGLIINFFQLDNLLQSLSQGFPGLTNLIILVISLASFIFFCGYFLIFWTAIGSTPGKLFMGLRIVYQNDLPPSFGRALLRFFGYWISAIPLFMGFLWVLVDPQRRGWHDRLAGTQVIYYWEQLRKK